MNITINSKEIDLKFTFNSFKYLEDFNIAELADIEKYPFKSIRLTEDLLFGAVNHDRKVKIKREEVAVFLEDYSDKESMFELLTTLMELLEDSSFFKSLQETTTQKK